MAIKTTTEYVDFFINLNMGEKVSLLSFVNNERMVLKLKLKNKIMEKFKTPLTWVLGIVCVGYLFIANCECGEESTCPLNNGFNISNTDINVDVLKIDAPETMEGTEKLTYYKNICGEDSLDVNGERVVKVEAIIIDSDTTIVEEINIDSAEVEIEEK